MVLAAPKAPGGAPLGQCKDTQTGSLATKLLGITLHGMFVRIHTCIGRAFCIFIVLRLYRLHFRRIPPERSGMAVT